MKCGKYEVVFSENDSYSNTANQLQKMKVKKKVTDEGVYENEESSEEQPESLLLVWKMSII